MSSNEVSHVGLDIFIFSIAIAADSFMRRSRQNSDSHGTFDNVRYQQSMIQDRKIRILCLTSGGALKQQVQEIFSHPSLSPHFEAPVFVEKLEHRSLRNREGFMKAANEADLIPPSEYKAFCDSNGQIPTNEYYQDNASLVEDPSLAAWKDTPINSDRRGSHWDLSQHYSAEFWRKAKSVGRDRPLLAHTLSHIIAMRRFLEEGFDVMIDENVCVPIPKSKLSECATRVRDTILASEASCTSDKCGIRYFGWSGSLKNMKWLLNDHFLQQSSVKNTLRCYIIPFPKLRFFKSNADIDSDKPILLDVCAYWISHQCYQSVLNILRRDVGSLLWRCKRGKNYAVRPLEQLMHSAAMKLGLEEHISSAPAFFRYPMVSDRMQN